MAGDPELLARVRAINDSAAFNRWCGFEVLRADSGVAEVAMPWRGEAGQYAGFLHAGLQGAPIDTACGFAAVTLVGRVLASHCAVNCLRPAVGERFVARARVVKPGKDPGVHRLRVVRAAGWGREAGRDRRDFVDGCLVGRGGNPMHRT